MRIARNAPLQFRPEYKEDDRRRHGRLRCESTKCSMGKVIDLSASGMCIERKGKCVKEGESFELTIQYDKIQVMFPVIVKRVQKIGFRRYQYGLAFDQIDENQQAVLNQFAQLAADRMVIG
ncbi:PilZ domain-containing protein [Poriferisphaera sp. WC338]|uniref:PilZ domain-containing protein n=1 Tax=Poriferisphaera sp. WC338 TaxID=3425129 RepID=UPI003D81BA7C